MKGKNVRNKSLMKVEKDLLTGFEYNAFSMLIQKYHKVLQISYLAHGN